MKLGIYLKLKLNHLKYSLTFLRNYFLENFLTDEYDNVESHNDQSSQIKLIIEDVYFNFIKKFLI